MEYGGCGRIPILASLNFLVFVEGHVVVVKDDAFSINQTWTFYLDVHIKFGELLTVLLRCHCFATRKELEINYSSAIPPDTTIFLLDAIQLMPKILLFIPIIPACFFML